MATDPEHGDLIEIFRGNYQHWALYVGDGDVIHLVRETGRANAGFSSVSSSSGSSSSGSSVGEDKAIVRREKLEDVAGQDKYRINNLLDDQRKPRPIEKILKEANSLVGKILPYNLLTHNCEHFVTLLRYGRPYSQQVKDVVNSKTVTIGVVLFPMPFVAFNVYMMGGLNSFMRRMKNKHRNGKQRNESTIEVLDYFNSENV